MLRFYKYHGLGNDFVVVDSRDQSLFSRAGLARWICHRRYGVGADGLLLLERPTQGGHLRMAVINSDGSTAEMCGNGLRCVARHAFEVLGFDDEDCVRIETDAGLRPCRRAPNTFGHIVAFMGPAQPIALVPGHPAQASGEVPARIQLPSDEGPPLEAWGLSMGNPHAVVFGSADAALALRLGPALSRHAVFPEGANIGFAEVVRPEELRLTVFERGAGLTQACGTGACAAAVAAARLGITARATATTVHLPGGALTVQETAEGVWMTGPAVRVFAGDVEPEAWEHWRSESTESD
jgi:diaminopimelate epimerase